MCGLGPRNLLPSAAGIPLLRVAAAEYLEGHAGVPLEVDIAMGMLVCKPIRRDEVCHEDAVDLVAILVVLNRIADLARPEDAVGITAAVVRSTLRPF